VLQFFSQRQRAPLDHYSALRAGSAVSVATPLVSAGSALVNLGLLTRKALLPVGLPRVLEYYWSNFSLLEYSLITISGCSFLQSIDELLEFMETLSAVQ